MAVSLPSRSELVNDMITAATIEQVRSLVGEVCDPELPPVTLADLGILRSVEAQDDTIVVTLTPTYSGCPAVEFIEDEVRRTVHAAGHDSVRIERAFSPPWSTEWITAEGRRKLSEAGIAPPRREADIAPAPVAGSGPVAVVLGRTNKPPVPCPRCGSTNTGEVSRFGSTACKSLHRCHACSEPFDHFKEI